LRQATQRRVGKSNIWPGEFLATIETCRESYPLEPTFEMPVAGLVRVCIQKRVLVTVCVVDVMSMIAAITWPVVRMVAGPVRV